VTLELTMKAYRRVAFAEVALIPIMGLSALLSALRQKLLFGPKKKNAHLDTPKKQRDIPDYFFFVPHG